MKMIIFLLLALFLQGSLGELVCEELPVGLCSFSIASSRNRCVLETYASKNYGTNDFQCKTSQVVAINLREHIESDECINACGIDRKAVGISSDALLDSHFTAKLCSPKCYYNCPNIVDLYYNLALGEGAFLPDLCKTSSRRSMAQIESSGVALGPVSAAPAAAPSASSSPVDCAPSPM